MHDAGPLVSLEDALRTIDDTLAGWRLPAEIVPTRSALGQVLAFDHASALDLPPFDKAAVDGYAICAESTDGCYRVLKTIAAGDSGIPNLEACTAVKVMTGAPVPKNTLRVVMVEDSELLPAQAGAIVRLRSGGQPNFCPHGEDMRRGGLALKAGQLLRPLDVANLTGCGIASVDVVRRPRMAVISTGDEIVDDPARLAPGKIMNVNGPLLCGLAAANGLDLIREFSAKDTAADIGAALESALQSAEVIALSGGLSVGDYDFALEEFSRAGLKLHFSRVAVKPGKPTAFATKPGKVVFGLPGNPLSVFLMFHLMVLRAVARLTGSESRTKTFALPLAAGFKRRKAERAEFVPATVTPNGLVLPLECHGSAHLLSLTHADGFFAVPLGAKEVTAGTRVEFMMVRQ
ncbi:MAG TPA: molybdopterin molybdotransferase MoeA [Planctomycetota bacterium]